MREDMGSKIGISKDIERKRASQTYMSCSAYFVAFQKCITKQSKIL